MEEEYTTAEDCRSSNGTCFHIHLKLTSIATSLFTLKPKITSRDKLYKSKGAGSEGVGESCKRVHSKQGPNSGLAAPKQNKDIGVVDALEQLTLQLMSCDLPTSIRGKIRN